MTKKLKYTMVVLAVLALSLISSDFKSIEESVLGAKRREAVIRTTGFASYKAINTAYTPRIPNYQIDTAKLANLAAFRNANGAFTNENLNKLRSVHFFTAPETRKFYSNDPESFTERSDDWAALYNIYKGSNLSLERTPDNSIFITTDFLAHLYHRILERQMEYLDKEEFAPRLKNISFQMLILAKQKAASASSENQESWQRVLPYLAVPAALLNGVGNTKQEKNAVFDTQENVLAALELFGLNSGAATLAKKEIEKIYAANGVSQLSIFAGLSPEFDTYDYTQFTPRSYYNKNAVLRSYFRAMMWYGRTGFALDSDKLTRDALNLSILMNDEEIAKLWQDIYEPTAFLVGKSDDLSFIDYLPFIKNAKEATTAMVAKVKNNAKNFAHPQILSSIIVSPSVPAMTEEELLAGTLGWRLMGQRFTLDGMIFSRLTQGDTPPDPSTGENLPSGITSAMIIAALGSDTANTYLQSWAKSNWPQSTRVLANKTMELRSELAAKSQSEWTQNSYWSWLYLYKSLITDTKKWTGYPKFMSFSAWRQKDLNTITGSWTELKHDTLLYAKQSYAERGGGYEEPEGKEPPPVKSYVEPNIEFFDRLESLVLLVNDSLTNLGLLHREIGYRSESFLEQVRFYRTIAVKELANAKISDEEFERLRLSPVYLTGLAGVLPGETETEKEARSALIADVHTDAAAGKVYYEAVGIPQIIFVAVSDINGTRLVKGLIYSQYEFTQPLAGTRLNDEQWQEYIYGGQTQKIPNLSPWSKF
jgi:hypothetical protein